MRLFIVTVVAIVAAHSFSSASAFAEHAPRAKTKHTWQKPRRQLERDCTPLNGRYGYYGNPWCDTGSSRPPDIDFRERHGLQQR